MTAQPDEPRRHDDDGRNGPYAPDPVDTDARTGGP